jgi:hypothetical protein
MERKALPKNSAPHHLPDHPLLLHDLALALIDL